MRESLGSFGGFGVGELIVVDAGGGVEDGLVAVDEAVVGEREDDLVVVDGLGLAEGVGFFADAGAGVVADVDLAGGEDAGELPGDGGGQNRLASNSGSGTCSASTEPKRMETTL